ncbi:MAG: T9SS type A sorting domain-containing protein [Bacteroidales bacterium]|nr:T9SS type A sorting domain-containing protein [Bacteroidales bacterium]
MKSTINKTLLALLCMLCVCSVHAQNNYYAKNTGEWNDSENWTTDASSLVYTNVGNVVLGMTASDEEYKVTGAAGKTMTLTMPENGDGNYIVINTMTVHGEVFINRPANSTQKIVIKNLKGTGVFKVTDSGVLRLGVEDAQAGNFFNMEQFEGTIVLESNSNKTISLGNSLGLINPEALQRPMPASKITKGSLALTTDYVINGDLTIEKNCTLYIEKGITVTVKGNVINHGTIQSVAAAQGGEDSKLVITGDLDNSDGTLILYGYNGTKTLNNTETEFIGNGAADLKLNATDASNNRLFRITANKDDNATLHVYASKPGNYLAVAAYAALNSGATYRELPFVALKGVFDLGQGVVFTGDANGWWNEISGGKFDPEVLKFADVSDSKGAIYVREGATLSISGADITIGKYNPVFIAGQLVINSGKFTTGGPGLFYVYPIRENERAGGIITSSQTPTRMTINGGELHASRIVSLNTSGAFRQAVHYQTGGNLYFDIDACQWETTSTDRIGYSNKTVCLGKGSQLVMHGGNMYLAKNAVGTKKTYLDIQILMADFSDPANPVALPTLIDGGTITITGTDINAAIGTCNNLVVERNASLSLKELESGMRVNGNMTIRGTMTPNNDMTIAGDVNITGTFEARDHDLKFFGKKNSTYNANAVEWSNIILEKEDNAAVTIADGTTLKVNGNITSNSGRVVGSVTMVGSSAQIIKDYTTNHAGLASVDLNIATKSVTGVPTLGTDVVLNNVRFNAGRKFQLGYHNLKIKNYPTSSVAWSATCGFEVPRENTASAHGLTLPVLATTNDEDKFPMIVGGYYTYVNILYTTTQIGMNAYVTVVPVSDKHPALKNDAAMKCYWIINSTANTEVGENFRLYKCLNFIDSDDLQILRTKRQIFFTNDGSRRGAELSGLAVGLDGVKLKAGTTVSYNTEKGGVGHSLSGEYTGGKSSDADNNWVYTSTKEGKWDDAIWKGETTGSADTRNGVSGSVIKEDDEVKVNDDITFDSQRARNAGVVTISNGKTLTIEESSISSFNAVSIKGDGILKYRMQKNKKGAISVLSAKHSELCNSTTAKLVFELNGQDRTLDVSTMSDYPNLEITGNGKLTIVNGTDFTVRGNLIISGNATFECSKGITVNVDKDILVGENATLIVGEKSGETELKVSGSIRNDGVITGGGCYVYLWNNVTNNKKIDIAGDVYFWGVSGNDEPVVVGGEATGGTKLGDAIIINKSSESCIVEFQTNVTTGADETVVDIQTGVLKLGYEGSTTLKQYPKAEAKDFNIPVDGSLYVTAGTANISIKGVDYRDYSLYLAGRLNLTGGATLNIHKEGDVSTRRGVVYSNNGVMTIEGPDTDSRATTLNVSYITPSSEGSSLDLTTSRKVDINCLGGTPMDGLGAFDIRNGNIILSEATTINITSHSRAPETTPSLYMEPRYAELDSKTTININSPVEFGIQSLSEIGTLNINGNAKLMNSSLSILGGLTIASGKTLDAAGHDITISGDLTAEGTYEVGEGQTTYFVGDGQQIYLPGNSALYNAVFDGTSQEVQGSVVVDNDLTVKKGVLTVSGTLRAHGDVEIDQEAEVAGNGLIVGSGAQSEKSSNLFCEGTVSILDIDNAAGVNCSLKQLKEITIGDKLKITNGVFDIAGNRIELLGNATIEGENFGIDKMISTNGSFTDNGIKMYWKIGDTKTFVIPLGKKGKIYTPIELNNVKATAVGDICFATVDAIHPELKSAIDTNSENVGKTALPYYWTFTCNTLQTSTGYIEMSYPEYRPDYVNASYMIAINTWDIGTTKIAQTEPMKIRISTENRKTFSGEYTACSAGMVVEPLGVFVSLRDGNWTDKIWGRMPLVRDDQTGGLKLGDIEFMRDQQGNIIIYNGNPVPVFYEFVQNAGAVIRSNVTVTTNGINAKHIYIAKDMTLEFAAGTKNNNVTTVRGDGILKVNSSLSFPSGRYDEFCSSTGGTIEYSGEDISYSVFEMPKVNNVKFTGTGERVVRTDIDVVVLGTLTVDGPKVVLNSGRSVAIEGKETALVLKSGSVTGNGYFMMDGNTPQDISVTGNACLPGLTIDNKEGVGVDNDLTVDNVKLVNGILNMNGHNLVVNEGGNIAGGSPTSFIDGKLKVSPRPGAERVYPIGDNGVYARTLMTTSEVGQWELQYVHKSPAELRSYDLSMLNEYWYLKAPSDEAEATIVVRWNGNSGGTFNNNNALVTRTNGEWDIMDYTNYTGNANNGTIKSILHAINNNGIGRYYALSNNSNISDYIWTGRAGTSWNDTQNWMYHSIPEQTSEVTIRKTSGNYPNLTSTSVFIKSMTIEQGAIVNIGAGSKTEISETLTVDNGGSLKLSGGTTNVKGDIRNAGTIILDGHGTNLYAVNIENNGTFNTNYKYSANPNLYYTGNLSGSNKFTVNRTFKTYQMYYVGSATEERLIRGLSGDYVYSYPYKNYSNPLLEKPNGEYKIKGTDPDGNIATSAFLVGLLGDGDRTLVQNGTLSKIQQYTVDAPAYFDEKTNENIGWIWVSQPYPFSLDVSGVVLDSLALNTIYTCTTGGEDDVFITYNKTSNISVNGDLNRIAPFQAIAIRNVSKEQSTRITFNPIKPTSATTLKSQNIETDVVRIKAINKYGISDEIALVFREGGSMKYRTSYDSDKMGGGSDYSPSISILKESKRCAIALYPSIDYLEEDIEIPLSLKGNNERGSLVISNVEFFDNSIDVLICYNGEEQNIRINSEFVLPNSDRIEDGDIKIVLRKVQAEETPTLNTTQVIKSISITAIDNMAVIDIPGLETEAFVTIYDLVGNTIVKRSIKAEKTIIPVEQNGIYIVQVVNGMAVETKKLSLKR